MFLQNLCYEFLNTFYILWEETLDMFCPSERFSNVHEIFLHFIRRQRYLFLTSVLNDTLEIIYTHPVLPYQKIAQSQRKHVNVGHISHAGVAQQSKHHDSVSNYTHHQD